MGSIPSQPTELKRTMKTRHLFMLSLGGTIGTGLFIGSGSTLNQGGPGGAIVAMILGGLITYMVMLCLGELTVYRPITGSFQAFTTDYVGPATGFMVGLCYWMGWATTVGLEFTAAGVIMQRWFPHVPVWVWCVIFIALLFTLNALTTRGFAETEFWFAGIKVVAVLIFIVLGLLAIFGVLPVHAHHQLQIANFTNDGGLFPHGFSAILLTMMTVVFGFQGVELMGIAAGESEDPSKSIPRAIRNSVFRIVGFYMLSIIILAAILPWRQAGLDESPFVSVLDSIGIPYAADLMNIVILTALLSVGNSGLYVCSRMLFSFAHDGLAPKIFGKLTKRGVPFYALLLSLAFALLSLLTSVYNATYVLAVLLAVSGMGTTIAWIAIALSQLFFRRKYLKSGGKLEDLKFRTPLYPWGPIISIAFCLFLIFYMLYDPTQRTSFYWGAGFIVFCYVYYYLFINKKRTVSIPETPAPIADAQEV